MMFIILKILNDFPIQIPEAYNNPNISITDYLSPSFVHSKVLLLKPPERKISTVFPSLVNSALYH
jgi:hypothetical protein